MRHLSLAGCETGFGVTDLFHALQQVACAHCFSAPKLKMPWVQFLLPPGKEVG